MDSEREQKLAEDLADLLDRRSRPRSSPAGTELEPELEVLDEIDRALDPPPPVPERLSGHRIVGEIGAGGMGRVLLARDEELGRDVAIKILSERFAESPSLKAQFMAEARSMARLDHPHIARIYSLGPAGEVPHFVMEFVHGESLGKAAAHLSFRQKAELVRKVALAVQFLHDHGIVHRDLKPANILVEDHLEPKLLDFGLALDAGTGSAQGGLAGTPEYLSPEQAACAPDIDGRSDVFSLGTIFYELLTSESPFGGSTMEELLRQIREEDPILPRRRNRAVPRDLQNICLKALEKDRERRYSTAREIADDLRRFLANEAVLAEPDSYARLIAGRVGQHLSDLESWRHDQILSQAEYEGIRKRYERLLEREDSWILEARRLTLPQVSLYLGAWILAVGSTLLTFFLYPALGGFPAVLLAWTAAVPTVWLGLRTWHQGNYRVAVPFLIAFCLLVPVALLVTLEEAHLFTGLTQGQERLELFNHLGLAKQATNAQLWWSLLGGLPVCWWLRRVTRAPVFSLLFATMAAMLCLTTLLRMGMLDWLEKDPGRFYFHLIPCAMLFLVAGIAFERLRLTDDSRYLYPFAVLFTLAALSGVALVHQPYADWLKRNFPWTRGQVEYLFILNAVLYTVFYGLTVRTASTQLRNVGKAFRFVTPGHVMTSLLLLGIGADKPLEARIFEWLLPAAACVFAFSSIPGQMKNFFVSGLVFFAAGVYRLQQNVFHERALWPVLLLVTGLALMLGAAHYAAIRMSLARVEVFPPVVQSDAFDVAVLSREEKLEMRYLKLLPVLACGILLAGCSRVLSLHQVAPNTPVPVDAALAGVWTDDEAKTFYKIEATETAYAITYSSPDLKDSIKLRGQLLAAGDPMLLDLASTADRPFALNCHAVVRLWLEGDRLRLAFLDSEWFQNQVRQALPSTKVNDDQVLILAPGDAARKLMLAGGNDPRALGEVEELHRVR